MSDDFLYFDCFRCRMHTKKIETITKVFREKILAAFSDIEKDVESEMERIEEEYPFDPDHDDPADICELSYERGIEYGIDLSEAKCLFIALTVVALYHDWEKSIIAFLRKEIGRNNKEPNISQWDHIVKWLEVYETPITTYGFYNDLNELRLVSHTIKHGKGPSYDKLKKLHATVLSPKEQGECSYSVGELSMLGVKLYIEQDDFDRYVAALLSFWDYEFWNKIGDKRCKKPAPESA